MTGLHLFKRHSQFRASEQRPCYLPVRRQQDKLDPPDLRAGCILIGLGVVLGLGYLLRSVYTPEGDMTFLFLFTSGFLFFGGLLLLFALGQYIVSKLSGPKKRCGCCRFFEVSSCFYVVGRCQADPSRHLVSRSDACPSFFFSERAMARDRLGHQPGALRQLQVIRASDAAKHS